jgi:hypothetical protein
MTDRTRRHLLFGIAAAGLPAPAPARKDERANRDKLSPQRPPESLHSALMRVLGEMPVRLLSNIKVLESVPLDGGRRDKIEFLSEPADPLFNAPADMIRAYLFVPDRRNQVLPAVVAIHQDGPQSHLGKSEPAGLAGDKNQYYGLELFQRGYVVLCPDRFGHAERRRTSPNDIASIDADRDDDLLNHRVGQLLLKSRTMFGKEVYDLMVATDVLTSLNYVDQNRVGAIGHSAGGNILIYLNGGRSADKIWRFLFRSVRHAEVF